MPTIKVEKISVCKDPSIADRFYSIQRKTKQNSREACINIKEKQQHRIIKIG